MKFRIPSLVIALPTVAFLAGWMSTTSFAQISISSSAAQVENFNSMGTSGLDLPTDWRVRTQLDFTQSTWATGSTAVNSDASSSAELGGAGSYNLGFASDRSVGGTLSGSLGTEVSVMARFSNNTGFLMKEFSVSYSAEQFRRNVASASVSFTSSSDGVSWNSGPSGLSVAMTPGSLLDSFSSPFTQLGTGTVTGLNLGNGPSDFYYLRWSINPGNATESHAIGIDDVSIRAARLATNGATVNTTNFFADPSSGLTIANDNAVGGTVQFNQTVNQVFNGTLVNGTGGGVLAVSKTGSGSLTLGGANSYTGGTTVSAGSLILAGAGTLGTGSLTVSGGTVDLGTKSVTNALNTLTGGAINNGTITNNSGTYFVQSGSIGAVLAGTNALSKTTAGSVTLSGANTFSGGTSVTAGTLVLGHATNTLSDGGTVLVDGAGATLSLGNNSDSVLSVSLRNGGAITGTGGILSATSFDLREGTVSAGLGGTGTLTKSTAGTVTLSAANSYSGGTVVNQGTLILSGAATLGSGGVTIDGGHLDLGGKNLANTLQFVSGGSVSNGTLAGAVGQHTVADGAVNANLAGSVGLVKNSVGSVTLTGVNTYTGNTDVQSGTLQVNGSINSSANAASTLSVNNSSLNIASGGSVAVGSTATIGSNGSVTVNGALNAGSLQSAGDLDVAVSRTVNAGSSASFTGDSTTTVNGTLTATTVSLAGTSRLQGAGVVNGNTTLASGTVLGPGNSPGTLTFNGNLSLAGTYDWEVVAGTNFADLTVVNGNLNLTGSVLNLLQSGTFTVGETFTLFAYSGTLTGTFSNGGSFSNWAINYGTGTPGANGNGGGGPQFITITAIPEPTSMLLVGLAALSVFPRRRRK